MKKKVPDWLNSSLWSTTPSSDDDHSRRYASKPSPTATSTDYDISEPPAVDPPVPVPPPSVVVERDSPKPETQDSNLSDDENGVSSTPSAEEISRQAQLLTEVWLSLPFSSSISLFFFFKFCFQELASL